MIITITGGSGSGKSAVGETIAQKLCPQTKYYIATMEAFGKEASERIAKHRRMRADKNFLTVECPVGLSEINLPTGSTAMLECMSNLTANEMFSENGCGTAYGEAPEKQQEILLETICRGVDKLATNCQNLIIITNEIFADGIDYDDTSVNYIRNLGLINQYLFKISDVCIESVYSIPVFHKGALPWQLSNL